MSTPTTPDARPADRRKQFLLAAVVVTLLLPHVPFGRTLGFPLVLMSTVAHEMGLALTALLLGDGVSRVVVNLDGSGLAVTTPDGRLASALVAAGGLVGPAVAGALCFASARSPRVARGALLLLGVLSLLAVVFWVRNPFGVAYVVALAVLLLAVGWRASTQAAQLVLVFVAVQLTLSVFSRWDYLFSDTATVGGTVRRSDSSAMADALVLPYWCWGLVCGAFSVVVLVAGAWLFLLTARGARPSRPGW